MAFARDLGATTDFESVLAAAKRGENWAWTEIYLDLAGVVTGYLRNRGVADPDDAASETFLQVARGIKSFDGDEASFRSWVFVIAHRRLIDGRRKLAKRPVVAHDETLILEIPDSLDVEDAALQQVAAAEIRKAFEQLTDDQRDVLSLRIIADLSLEQTAHVLGKGVGAVKALQRRGLAALRRSTHTSRVSK